MNPVAVNMQCTRRAARAPLSAFGRRVWLLELLDRMAHYDLAAPLTEEAVRQAAHRRQRQLERTLFGIRDATQIHMFDRGRKTRFDLTGHR